MDNSRMYLVKKAMKGDSSAFEKLIAPKQREILYFAKCFCGPEEAEDIAQEALVHAFRNIAQLKNPEKFNSWLFKLVRNDCLLAMRKRRKEQAIPMDPHEDSLTEIEDENDEFLPLACVENADMREQLLEVVRSLPEKNVNCLMLFYYEGLSHKEIAEVLDSTPKTVSNDLVHARELLRRKLAATPQFQYKHGAAVAGMSLLGKAFEADAFQSITADMCMRLGAGLHESFMMTAASASGGTGTLSAEAGNGAAGNAAGLSTATTAAKGGGLAFGVKVAAGFVLCVAAAGGGIAAYQASLPENPPAAVIDDAQNTAAPEPVEASVEPIEPPVAGEPDEEPIDSLADMIGAEHAQTLEAYVRDGADKAAWTAFVEILGARPEYQVTTTDDEGYFLSVLDKQDMRLLLFEHDDGSGRVSVVYEFGTQESLPIPRVAEIALIFREG